MPSPRILRPLLPALLALVFASPASAGDDMYIGAAEDSAKSTDLVEATAKIDLALLAGYDAVRLTAIWAPGQAEPVGEDLVKLENAIGAAQLRGVRVVLSVYHRNSRTTPTTPEARARFAAFAAGLARRFPHVTDFVIGNEPNLNGFWMPQFNPDGSSASPAGYFELLAATYDALKAVSPDVTVIGGSVSPRGANNPTGARQTHSPARFISELGRAYRESGRRRPVMDEFSFHPYGENSSVPPELPRHPRSNTIGLSGYWRLVSALGRAFDGTRQPGADIPIVYDEYGHDTLIPPEKAALYAGREHATTRPVSEAVQGDYYRRALAMAACQPTVRGFLLFLVSDEPGLAQWQSGIFYADDTPKASFPVVRDAVRQARRGTLARCASAPAPEADATLEGWRLVGRAR
jgi:hypothetical protein